MKQRLCVDVTAATKRTATRPGAGIAMPFAGSAGSAAWHLAAQQNRTGRLLSLEGGRSG